MKKDLKPGYEMGKIFTSQYNLKGERALDVGAGHAAHSSAFADSFDEVVCLDITDVRFDKKLLSEFAPNADRLVFVTGKAEDMKYEEEFDLVYSLSALEHMEDWKKVVKNMAMATKVGGKIFIVISPFYYSELGHHLDPEMKEWEHLTLPNFKDVYFKRGGSDYGWKIYLELNKMIPADLINELGKYCVIDNLIVSNKTIKLLATK